MFNNIDRLIYILKLVQPKSALILVGLMVVGFVFELGGIGLVVPVLSVIVNPQVFAQYEILDTLLEGLAEVEPIKLAIYGLSLMVSVYLVKTIYLIFLSWKQASFTYNVYKDVSRRLFLGYLSRPYSYYLDRNSAQLVRNETREVATLTTAISAFFTISVELLVLIGILTLLIYFHPIAGSIMFFIIGATAGVLYYFTRKISLRWGSLAQYHDGLRLKHLQHGIGGIKEIKISGRKDEFVRSFSFHNEKSSDMLRNQSVIQRLPRLMLELVGICCMPALLIILYFLGESTENIITIVGLFAFAALRLLPSAGRIVEALQRLRYSYPSINVLHDELRNESFGKEKVFPKLLQLEDKIVLEGVSFVYPNTDTTVLEEVNIEIVKGQTIGIFGDSGSGKTTLIDLLTGLIEPTKGKITSDGIEVSGGAHEWRENLGYVPQSIYMIDDSIKNNIAFGIPEDVIDMTSVRWAASAAGIDDFVHTLPDGFDTHVGERGEKLSGGQLQRVGLARALYHRPSLLVLDEATNALDMKTEREVMRTVNALHGDITMVIIAHNLRTLDKCDLTYTIDNKRVIERYLNGADI